MAILLFSSEATATWVLDRVLGKCHRYAMLRERVSGQSGCSVRGVDCIIVARIRPYHGAHLTQGHELRLLAP